MGDEFNLISINETSSVLIKRVHLISKPLNDSRLSLIMPDKKGGPSRVSDSV